MPPQGQYQYRRLISVAAIFLLLALALRLWQRESKRTPLSQTQVVPATIQASAPQTAPALTVMATRTNNPTDASARGLQEMFGSFKTVKDAKAARQSLAELRRALSAMPTAAAVAAIRQFLDSKEDASTHLGFKVAGNGLLDEAPTLRTFLLDELARLDPAAAADYAKVVLANMDSPDEWAVALRNLALGNTSTEARALLLQKTEQMLQYAPWQQNPSTGFLEAFDVAVYLGGTDLMPALSSLVRQQDNPAVAHAAYLALDRLVISDATTTLNAMQADPDLMQGRELTRANYFARADVRDPQQRQVLESYLLDPRIGAAEIAAFAGVYPNANFMISPNLITQTQPPARAALTSRDAASLAVAQQWLADPRFANLGPELQNIIVRLQTFVQQANQGP
jgi:hypothetical protein